MMQPNGVIPPPMPPMPMNQQQQQPQQYQQQPQQYQQQPPPQQQWVAMPPPQQQFQPQPPSMGWAQQPPQAAVSTPHQMQAMQAQTHPQQYSAAPTSSDEIRSLWIGDLLPWMDENYVSNCFYHTGELLSVKIIRNKQTYETEGYGFLEFRTRAAAETALQTYNGSVMPNAQQNFRLNWATLGAGERRTDDTPGYTVFVGDLSADVTDYVLQETFKSVYSSVKGAKVVIDRTTGRSKGYGFVRFGDESEQMRAMTEMNGVFCSTRPMRVGPAATKKSVSGQQYQKDYCLSNDYINSIITHQFELDGGDLAPYYVSFLRAVSGKITRGTLCLLVKVHEDVVVSFPLYTEALKFAHHGEKMIQIAVRAITLNIFNVSDDMVYQFMTTPPVSEYFSGLVLNLRTQCFHLDAVVHATENTYKGRREELLLETDKIVDDLYYFKDIYSVGELHLSKTLTRDLVSMLVFPILLPLVHLSQSSGTQLSAITSLFVVSRLLQVLEGTNMANFVASAILCFHMSSSIEDVNNLHNLEEMVCPEPEGDENFKRSNIPGHLSDFLASSSHILSFLPDDINKESSSPYSRGCERGDGNVGLVGEETNSLTVHQAKRPDQQLSKPMYDGSLKRNFSHENGEDDGVLLTYQDVQLLCRGGIIQFILSEDHGLMLASLMLLLVLAESKADLNYQLAAMMGFSQSKSRMPK
ncbi:unnamed protein product, partial [Ilex paraguariensis]